MRLRPLAAQVVALNALLLGYIVAYVLGFHPWGWILPVVIAWSGGVMVVCSVEAVYWRRQQRRWNEELHRLIDFNKMLAEERREKARSAP